MLENTQKNYIRPSSDEFGSTKTLKIHHTHKSHYFDEKIDMIG